MNGAGVSAVPTEADHALAGPHAGTGGLGAVEHAAALEMIRSGVPVVTAPPANDGREFQFRKWGKVHCSERVLLRWRPGWMLAARTGRAFDVIDIDPRNGGDATVSMLRADLPIVAGIVRTPGGGLHLYTAPYGGPSVSWGGIDYLAKDKLVYIPGCSRPKYQGRGYTWAEPLDWDLLQVASGNFPAALVAARAAAATKTAETHIAPPPGAGISIRSPRAYARAALYGEADAVGASTVNRNNRLNTAAFLCGQLLHEDTFTPDFVMQVLLDAADENGLLAEDGITVCRATIASGLAAGARSRRTLGAPRA